MGMVLDSEGALVSTFITASTSFTSCSCTGATTLSTCSESLFTGAGCWSLVALVWLSLVITLDGSVLVSLGRVLPGLLRLVSTVSVLVLGLLRGTVPLLLEPVTTAAATAVGLLSPAVVAAGAAVCLSVKSMQVHLPRFRGSVVSTLTTLNLVLKS